MKASSAYILIAGLMLVIVGLAACSKAPATASPAPAGVAVTEGWTVYRDQTIGCTLQYPADAHFEHGVNKYGIATMRLQFSRATDEGHQGMVIRAVPRGKAENMDALLQQVYASGAHEASLQDWRARLSDVTVNGAPAWRTQCSVEGGDFAVIIPHKDWVFVASPTHDQAANCSEAGALTLFDQVLGTLVLE